jgi:AcrR family transcriptional regulator
MIARRKVTASGPRGERGEYSARIVEAARAEFGTHGWSGTTIRGIARAAAVDPALVYHYFGSKRGLLDASIQLPDEWLQGIRAGWNEPAERLGEVMVRLTVRNWADPRFQPTLRAIALTAAIEPASQVRLQGVVRGILMRPAEPGVDEDERLRRSALAASQLLGFVMMKYVWQIEPIASMGEEDAVAFLAPTVQGYLDGSVGAG